MQNKRQDKELQEYRNLMEVPTDFEDGFSFSSLVGALFLALIMVPGCLYMELIAGLGIGPAAQWVTVILFVEIAKRANARLSRAQLFILFYIAGLLVGQQVHGTPLFRQFLVKSESAVSFGISSIIPSWVAPMDNAAYETRSFFQLVWLPALGLMVFTRFFGSLNSMILGYGLFRQTSDIEKLPFPLAPVGAQGIIALAEEVDGTTDQMDKSKSPRWRVFCIGGAIGMVFGLLYMGIPTLSGAVLGKTMTIFPIPFVDWTPYTADALPAVATGFSFNLGNLILGMVMPFYAMLGSFIGLIITVIANPILYKFKILHLWEHGDGTVETLFKNNIDFYFSFGIGVSLTIAIAGIWSVVSQIKNRNKDVDKEQVAKDKEVLEKRGDIKGKFIIAFYFLTTMLYVLLSGYLINWHTGVMLVLVFYGFIYTPMISYVTAKLEGIAGQVIEIPFIRELSFILSGYQGVGIWFIPVPKANYGRQTVFYRQAELIGCKFTSIWKANLILLPIVIISMLFFSNFIWRMAPIPSYLYPYTEQIWELEAKNTCLLYSSTLGEYSPFQDALSVPKIGVGLFLGTLVYAGLSWLNAPVMLIFGVVRGLGQTLPHAVTTQFIGALLGRYYFRKKYGDMWLKFVPVLSAGFFVGSGLISMFFIGIVFLIKSVTTLPY